MNLCRMPVDAASVSRALPRRGVRVAARPATLSGGPVHGCETDIGVRPKSWLSGPLQPSELRKLWYPGASFVVCRGAVVSGSRSRSCPPT